MSPFRAADHSSGAAGRRARTWQLSGTGLPDLLVEFRGRYYVGEVKSKGGTETVHQGAFPIWRTPDDLLHAIGARCAECGFLSRLP